jgi:DNA-directed RNA polymerase subunit K/omega
MSSNPKKKITFEDTNKDIKDVKKTDKKIGGAKTESESDSDYDTDDSEIYDEVDIDDDDIELDEEEDEEEENVSSVESEEEDTASEGEGDGDCMYKFTNKKSLIDEEEGDDGDTFYFEEDEKLLQNDFVPNDKRITKSVLTKYERVRVLSDRTKQLSLNAKPMMKGVEKLHPKEIAKLELENGVLPFIIIRTLPTGKKEKWRVNELAIVN